MLIISIVYCKDKDRTEEYRCTEFEFLGYTFRRILIKDRCNRLQWNFLVSVSKGACKTLKEKIKALEIHARSGSKIEMIAKAMQCRTTEELMALAKSEGIEVTKE